VRRCVCGRSATFPRCDGAHADAGWACGPEAPAPGLAIAAGPALQSLADGLAARLSAQPAHRGLPARPAALVRLCDPADPAPLAGLRADRELALAIGLPAHLAAAALPGVPVLELPDEPLDALWAAAVAAISAPWPPAAAAAGPLPAVFLSHAVADEPLLELALLALRAGGRAVFSCADSIPPGSDWAAALRARLADAPLFVQVVSDASLRSTFCAWEAGAAAALGKQIRAVLLPGAALPAWLQGVQAEDVARRQARRPWLGLREAVAEALVLAAG